jgi:polar amino acid transport system ATP-binding protein
VNGEENKAQPLLRIEHLSKRFGKTAALIDASFKINRGERVVLIGASGSGKSTLLRCINYLEVPDEGTIWLDGELIGGRYAADGKWVKATHRELAYQRRKIGMVFQSFNLFAHLSALDNIAIGPQWLLQQSKQEARERAQQLLQKVHLADHGYKLPGQLSGGQQQRVAIARALAMEPQLMLFDEPTSALDPRLTREVLEVMIELAREQMTMVIVTHELGFAREVADTVGFLDEGRVIERGTPAQIFTNPRDPRTQSFLACFESSFQAGFQAGGA